MSRNPQQMWEKGVPFSKAWLELSEFSMGESFQYKRKFSALSEGAKEGSYIDEGIYEEYEPKDMSERLFLRHKLKNSLQNNLIAHLEGGELIAIGYMVYPELREVSDVIPGAYFIQVRNNPENFYWEDNLFEGKTAHYQRVRIIDPNLIDNQSGDGTGKRGRPSKADLIYGEL